MCYLDAYNNSVSEVVYTHAYTDTHIHAPMCTQDIKNLAGQTSYIMALTFKNSDPVTPIFCSHLEMAIGFYQLSSISDPSIVYKLM